jgi:hypothetical protein
MARQSHWRKVKDSSMHKVYRAEREFWFRRHAGYNYRVAAETFGRDYRPDLNITNAQDMVNYISSALGFEAPTVETNCRAGGATKSTFVPVSTVLLPQTGVLNHLAIGMQLLDYRSQILCVVATRFPIVGTY